MEDWTDDLTPEEEAAILGEPTDYLEMEEDTPEITAQLAAIASTSTASSEPEECQVDHHRISAIFQQGQGQPPPLPPPRPKQGITSYKVGYQKHKDMVLLCRPERSLLGSHYDHLVKSDIRLDSPTGPLVTNVLASLVPGDLGYTVRDNFIVDLPRPRQKNVYGIFFKPQSPNHKWTLLTRADDRYSVVHMPQHCVPSRLWKTLQNGTILLLDVALLDCHPNQTKESIMAHGINQQNQEVTYAQAVKVWVCYRHSLEATLLGPSELPVDLRVAMIRDLMPQLLFGDHQTKDEARELLYIKLPSTQVLELSDDQSPICAFHFDAPLGTCLPTAGTQLLMECLVGQAVKFAYSAVCVAVQYYKSGKGYQANVVLHLTMKASLHYRRTTKRREGYHGYNWLITERSESKDAPRQMKFWSDVVCRQLVLPNDHQGQLFRLLLAWDKENSTPLRPPIQGHDPTPGFKNPAPPKDRETILYSFLENQHKVTCLIGPPGTGKTEVCLDTLGVWMNRHHGAKWPEKALLITAASNYACNVVAERILANTHLLERYGHKNFMRVFAPGGVHTKPWGKSPCRRLSLDHYIMDEEDLGNSRIQKIRSEYQELDSKVKEALLNPDIEGGAALIQQLREDQDTLARELLQVLQPRVIIATCAMAVSEVLKGVSFSHIILDEASQATLPLAFMGLSKLAPGGSVMIVGDDQQLPPTVFTKGDAGYLLQQNPPQVLRKHRNVPVVELQVTFRAPPALMAPYQRMFYPQLTSGVADQQYHSLHQQIGVPYPIIWKECLSLDSQIIRVVRSTRTEVMNRQVTGSHFNTGEVHIMTGLLDQLEAAQIDLATQVKMITYYKAQQGQLTGAVGDRCPVLTVDQAQGSEADIIILSTVRSGGTEAKPSKTALKDWVGFLQDPHRFNVALSRARKCLFIVGNSKTLEADPLWKELIQYLRSQNAPFQWSATEVEKGESSKKAKKARKRKRTHKSKSSLQ